MGLEFNANGGILSEMTHPIPGVDADAIMRMKLAVSSKLAVRFTTLEGGRLQSKEVALEPQIIDVPTDNNYTILFETEAVVGPSVGVCWGRDEQIFVTEDNKNVCYFESDTPLSEETMKLSLRFDRNLTLHCFVMAGGLEKKLKKHSFFYSGNNLQPQFFSLQGCVQEAWKQLRERKAEAEKQMPSAEPNQTAEWIVKRMLETEEMEPSLLLRALYNVMEQDRFESMRRQVGTKRNQVDVITTQARKKGVKLERIEDTFDSIRNRFINGKATQEVVTTTKEKLQALKQ